LIALDVLSAKAFLLPVGSSFPFRLLRLPARRASLRGCLLLAPPSCRRAQQVAAHDRADYTAQEFRMAIAGARNGSKR
jgi:hypothetical protein